MPTYCCDSVVDIEHDYSAGQASPLPPPGPRPPLLLPLPVALLEPVPPLPPPPVGPGAGAALAARAVDAGRPTAVHAAAACGQRCCPACRRNCSPVVRRHEAEERLAPVEAPNDVRGVPRNSGGVNDVVAVARVRFAWVKVDASLSLRLDLDGNAPVVLSVICSSASSVLMQCVFFSVVFIANETSYSSHATTIFTRVITPSPFNVHNLY